MSKSLRFIFLLFPTFLFSQIKVENPVFDHGNIENFRNDTAFFYITNKGNQKTFLLPTQAQEEYEILTDGNTLEPQATMTLAVVYYTDKKGKFNVTVPIYFSSMYNAVQLSVKGNIKSIEESALSKCPSIENSRPLQASQVPIKIVVKDAENEEILGDLNIQALQNRDKFNCVSNRYSNIYSCKCKYGMVRFNVEKQGYLPKELDFNYHADNYYVIIYLEKEKEKKTNPDSIIEQPKPLVVQQIDTLETTSGYVPAIYEKTELKTAEYKPNHLIFIIDISGSMKDSTKLNFLKASMKKLIQEVRPQDHITLMTYASRVKTIFENQSGLNRDAILTAIDTLQAKGASNGAESMYAAYEYAEKYYIKDGNNQIFLATDGLFNSSKIKDDELYRLVKKQYNRKQIKFSSIAFGKDSKAINFLLKLAEYGNGSFLKIENTNTDLNVLIDEVKKQSLR